MHGKQHTFSDTAAAMSEATVELVGEMVDAWNRGDITGWVGALDEEVEWYPLAETARTDPIHGVDAVLEFVADWIKPGTS